MKKALLYLFLSIGIIRAQNNAQTNPPANEESKGSLTGFDGLKWGSKYGEAKEHFRTIASSPGVSEPANIISDTPENEIKLKRKNVIYRYVFYQTPEILRKNRNSADAGANANPDTAAPENKSATNNNEASARLFFIESSFPYVPALELQKNIEAKYGPRNGGTLDDKTNRGFYVWTLNSGYIIQWIDPYKQKPFSRSIYYVSKEILEEIKADYPKFLYSSELKTMKNILY
ncbi:MAG: hypothetical protein OEV66_06360 [Spirochaetia bacterium]|nr:hypothetical protein [Spirochaetia bacterium]